MLESMWVIVSSMLRFSIVTFSCSNKLVSSMKVNEHYSVEACSIIKFAFYYYMPF